MRELNEGRSLFGSSSDHYGHCCPPVFDPYTLVALIGGIALATFFLRLVIINQVFNGRSLNVFGKNQTCKTENIKFDTISDQKYFQGN